MFKLLVAARKEGKLVTPAPGLDNEAVRYEHRFGAFVGLLTPPLAPYTQYKVGHSTRRFMYSTERALCVLYTGIHVPCTLYTVQ